MRVLQVLVLAAVCALVPAAARDLQIYFIDVEGGQATLIVSPSGESMLVDAGWPGFNGRDQDRIVAAAKKAGLKQIDYMLMTHYHLDHVGGIPPLIEKLPAKTFIDHGENTETDPRARELAAAYAKVRATGKHLVVKPGDKIPMKGVDIDVVAARGEVIGSPLKGAGQSVPACAGVAQKDPDNTENGKSIAFILRYGNFRFADFADLTWNKELGLVCPRNLIGEADLYLVTHHGMNISNAPVLVNTLRPRVAIGNNGVKKGGSPDAMKWIRSSPGLEDLWQLHAAAAAGDANAAEQFIANPEAACKGNMIVVTASQNGTFTVTNERNGFTKTYRK